jgi:hypothetical protein
MFPCQKPPRKSLENTGEMKETGVDLFPDSSVAFSLDFFPPHF